MVLANTGWDGSSSVHTLASPSVVAAASSRSPGPNVTEYAGPPRSAMVASATGAAGSATFHSQTEESLAAAASWVPSTLNATCWTMSVGPVSSGPTGVGWDASAMLHNWVPPSV